MSPAVAPAQKVQGINSQLTDITLHDGRKIRDVIGGAITPSPTLTRTIDGASSLTIPVYDPDHKLLRNSLLSAKFDANVDGLWFRYIGASKAGELLTLTLIDRTVARLQEFNAAKSALRRTTTRAEFIKSLFEKAVPGFPFYCPQLHVVQPIKNETQAKKAGDEAKENRGKGIGDTKGLKVKTEAASQAQIKLGNMGLEIAASHHSEERVAVALMVALIVETLIGKLAPGNVLEAEGSGEGADVADAATEITNFLTGSGGYGSGGAIGYAKRNPKANPFEIAQAVQRSGAGAASNGAANYGPWVGQAREWFEAFGGGESGSTTVTQEYEFKVEEGENYWDTAKRLAQEVKWRLFILPDRAILMPETELIASQVRLAIDAGTDLVETVDFDFNVNKKVTEVTIEAFAAQWELPPGVVATLADYGPASLGPGDAPSKSKVGVSSAVKASTHEGKGRYLVSSIVAPLTEDSDARKVTITAKKPTRPLPEPAPEKETVSGATGGTAGGAPSDAPAAIQKMIAEIDATDGNFEYAWGGGHESVSALHHRLKGYDCSGYVSHILWAGGLLDTPESSVPLESFGDAGKGEWITIYANTEHAFGEIKTSSGWRGFQSGGQANSTGWCDESKLDDRGRFIARHPKGL